MSAGAATPATALKVLVVTNMYPTEDEPWFGCFVREQVEDLISLSIDVRLVHFDGRADWMNYLRAARTVRRLVSTDHFDLVHAHYGLTGAAAVAQRQVPVLTTFHGSDHSGEIRWQKYVSWIVARHSFPVFVSEEGRRHLMRPSAPVIPAGVDTELFSPIDRPEARRRLGWATDGRYVLLPGSRSAPKQPLLFDAALAEARKTAPDLRGVALAGFSRERAALVFNAVDVTLMTSRREGSPVAIRESLACMTPVVSVPVGDVPKVLTDLPGCGIFPRTPEALARGVLAALDANRSPVLRERAEQYSRRRTAERLVAVYRSVASLR
jgi:teichuronic acid biosynthesis glycosyltransferase TuaC